LNGRNLGRYWPVKGPTKTLYVPGVWLSQGDNEVGLVYSLRYVVFCSKFEVRVQEKQHCFCIFSSWSLR